MDLKINEEQAATEPHQPLKKSRKQIAHAIRSSRGHIEQEPPMIPRDSVCLLYTSDAADE